MTGETIMAKREIPLFIIDRTRRHKRGECDFLVCTDKDSGFIARLDYVSGEIEEAGDDYRIGVPNGGISCKMRILRMTGERPDAAAVRTLMKRGMDYYASVARREISVESPSRDDCIEFIKLLVDSNRHNLQGRPLNERQITARSISMLEAAVEYLKGKE